MKNGRIVLFLVSALILAPLSLKSEVPIPTYKEARKARERAILAKPLQEKEIRVVQPFPSQREMLSQIRKMEKLTSFSRQPQTIIADPPSNKPHLTVGDYFKMIRHPIRSAKERLDKRRNNQ